MKRFLLTFAILLCSAGFCMAETPSLFNGTTEDGTTYRTINGITYIYDKSGAKLGSVKRNNDGTADFYDAYNNKVGRVKINPNGTVEMGLDIPGMEKFKVTTSTNKNNPYSVIELSDGYTNAKIKTTEKTYESEWSNSEGSGALDAEYKEGMPPAVYGYDNKDRKGPNILNMFNFISNPMNNAK